MNSKSAKEQAFPGNTSVQDRSSQIISTFKKTCKRWKILKISKNNFKSSNGQIFRQKKASYRGLNKANDDESVLDQLRFD